MSADPEERTSDRWHEALRAADAQRHAAEDRWMVENAVDALEERLRQANADRHAMQAAVATRDRLLGELSVALTERDARVLRLEADLEHLLELGRRSLSRRVLSRGRRELDRVLRRSA